jgi:predicted transposase/invertase (TIGR01784 family)
MRHVLPTNDLALKKILASEDSKEIACGFIRDFGDLEVSEQVLTITEPYNIQVYQEKLKETGEDIQKFRQTIRDVSFSARTKDLLVELQVQKEAYFSHRSLYYPFSKYCGNYNREGYMKADEEGKPDRYSSLRPVYSLNILKFTHFADEDALRIFRLYDKKREKEFGKDLISIGYFELNKKKGMMGNQGDWRKFFISGEAPEGAPGYIRKAAGIIEYTNMREEERGMIDAMEKAQADIDGYLVTAYYEGKEDTKYEAARNAVAEGLSPEVIHRITGLDIATIQQIVTR